MSNIRVGSICSGIEAASVAWSDLGYDFEWFSEISTFPSKLLAIKYPDTPNLGDMCDLPTKLAKREIAAPDLICGGTPCQAFSLAGWKKGLEDVRGNLTLKFVDIINANDEVRQSEKKPRTILFWENVEGVLRDKTNAFGCLLASLAGYEEEIRLDRKWPQAGLLRGPLRNVAWRVIDAKYFGLPQQRRRLYLIAGGKDFNPEDIIFEVDEINPATHATANELKFEKEGYSIEIFRSYTDCLYSAYGTKWNGNAAAYNGSLFVRQNGRLRRLTPLECERLMGFPDNYTEIPGAKTTSRYQAVGNSWAVPVVKWLGQRMASYLDGHRSNVLSKMPSYLRLNQLDGIEIWDVGKEPTRLKGDCFLNGSLAPCDQLRGDMKDIIDVSADDKLYITPVGCQGILRRKEERQLTMNSRLENVLREISSTWTEAKIEAVSRRQPRGRFSSSLVTDSNISTSDITPTLWEE